MSISNCKERLWCSFKKSRNCNRKLNNLYKLRVLGGGEYDSETKFSECWWKEQNVCTANLVSGTHIDLVFWTSVAAELDFHSLYHISRFCILDRCSLLTSNDLMRSDQRRVKALITRVINLDGSTWKYFFEITYCKWCTIALFSEKYFQCNHWAKGYRMDILFKQTLETQT